MARERTIEITRSFSYSRDEALERLRDFVPGLQREYAEDIQNPTHTCDEKAYNISYSFETKGGISIGGIYFGTKIRVDFSTFC